MLKLEKDKRSKDIAITIRKKENFFEPVLLQALFIAAALHISGLIIFQVAPISFSSSFTFPPIHVQTDISQMSSSVLMNIPHEADEFKLPPINPLPLLDWTSFFPMPSHLSPLTFNPEELNQIEEIVWPRWEDPLLIEEEDRWIQLDLSENIAKHSLVEADPILQEVKKAAIDHYPFYIAYEVQLDPRTGQVFWFEPIQKGGFEYSDEIIEEEGFLEKIAEKDKYEKTEIIEPKTKKSEQEKSVKKLAEKILLSLRFSTEEMKKHEMIKGKIELTFLLGY